MLRICLNCATLATGIPLLRMSTLKLNRLMGGTLLFLLIRTTGIPIEKAVETGLDRFLFYSNDTVFIKSWKAM